MTLHCYEILGYFIANDFGTHACLAKLSHVIIPNDRNQQIGETFSNDEPRSCLQKGAS